jgi:hypothetical protein
MQKKRGKRIALTVLSVFVLLVVVLAVHIYVVTRPRVDDTTRIMARIDIRQSINQEDSTRITDWLYRQKGVDHVLVNPRSAIVIFTFSPVKNNAGRIVADFRAGLPYKAERYLPAAEDMRGGCPVASTSFTYKVYSFMKRVF